VIQTPKSLRLHIGIFGRRNVGKSSLLNALTRQNVSIVSDVAGTTTDPVEKPMELLPIGPVVFIDTAGVDDEGMLGEMRIERTRKVFDRTDVGLLVTTNGVWSRFELDIIRELQSRSIPIIVVINKIDEIPAEPEFVAGISSNGFPCLPVSSLTGTGTLDVREALIRLAPDEIINTPSILGDLLPPGELAILVVPIDMEAPKGRLIMPQVQSIRDILDNDAYCMVVKERELRDALERLKRPPALVVTDSQAFLKVAADTPIDIPMTSFSILFARFKGDLTEFVRGAAVIDSLRTGDRVLIAESCSHHPIGDDIGRVKIPRWLTQYVGGKLEFTFVQGRDFPADLESFRLVIHCGSCMFNRREMLSRILECRIKNVPITNYGVAIAFSLGVFDRALKPFPAAMEAFRSVRNPSG